MELEVVISSLRLWTPSVTEPTVRGSLLFPGWVLKNILEFCAIFPHIRFVCCFLAINWGSDYLGGALNRVCAFSSHHITGHMRATWYHSFLTLITWWCLPYFFTVDLLPAPPSLFILCSLKVSPHIQPAVKGEGIKCNSWKDETLCILFRILLKDRFTSSPL